MYPQKEAEREYEYEEREKDHPEKFPEKAISIAKKGCATTRAMGGGRLAFVAAQVASHRSGARPRLEAGVQQR